MARRWGKACLLWSGLEAETAWMIRGDNIWVMYSEYRYPLYVSYWQYKPYTSLLLFSLLGCGGVVDECEIGHN